MKQLQARPHQVIAAQKIKSHFHDGLNNQLVELPTGTGKTVLFSILPKVMEIGKRRMLVLVHREKLADQAAQKLRSWNPTLSVGIEMGSYRADNCQIVVASVQTLGKEDSSRLQALNPEDFAIIVTDECHHATAESYQRIFKHFKVRQRKDILNLGVTATSKRGDGKGLKGTYDVVSHSWSVIDAIREGWLSDLRCKRIVTDVDFDEIAIKNGDFDPVQLTPKLNTDANNDLIVKHYLAEAKGKRFMAFCQDIEHSKSLAAAFKRAGVKAEAVWGVDPEQDSKVKRHQAGEIDGLINAELFIEGYDDPGIECVIIAKITLSEGRYKQMVGRVTRLEDGVSNRLEAVAAGLTLKKPYGFVLDAVGLSTKHALHTLPTLGGFGPNTNLGDKSLLEAVEEVEALKETQPLLNVKGLDDISNLKSYAETVNLLAALVLPELIQMSEYRWQKVDDDAYGLPLINDEVVIVIQDQAGAWHLKGTVNSYKLEGEFLTLEEAIAEADYNVRYFGGRMWKAKAKRANKAADAPASASALKALGLYGLTPLPGMTEGEAHALVAKAIRHKQYLEKNNA